MTADQPPHDSLDDYNARRVAAEAQTLDLDAIDRRLAACQNEGQAHQLIGSEPFTGLVYYYSQDVSKLLAAVRAAQRRADVLERALLEQWEEAHFDHCGRWPHTPERSECQWPKPVDLLAARGEEGE